MSTTTDSLWEDLYKKDAQALYQQIKESGVSGMEKCFKERLDRWREVKINIGIIGASGAGKSTLINVIRRLADDDEGAAETGVNETTEEEAVYPHPDNSKINFCDLPGLGTPKHPSIEIYRKTVNLDKYDTFLIVAQKRFTEYDRLLAGEVGLLKKSFFFVRTHMDVDNESEKLRSVFNEEKMLNGIREECLKNLKDLGDRNLFLISNRDPEKWDFPKLTQAIVDALPERQRECLTLFLANLSTDILKGKAQLLRGRIWMVALADAIHEVPPLFQFSGSEDPTPVTKELLIYKKQFGLPDDNSKEFQRMTLVNQEKVRKYLPSNSTPLASCPESYADEPTKKEFAHLNPWVDSGTDLGISFQANYHYMRQCLKELEEAALNFLREKSTSAAEDREFDDIN